MSEFTVTFQPSGEESFDGDSTWHVDDNGVLRIQANGRIRHYSPSAWHHVDSPRGPSRAVRGKVTVL